MREMIDAHFWEENTALEFWKRYYLDVWTGILSTCLGWSEQQVLEWAREKKFLEALDDSQDPIYHQVPQCWVSQALIPETLKAKLTARERHQLSDKIQTALKSDIAHYRFFKDTNWEPYKEQIERILAEYGKSSAPPKSSS